MCVVATVCDQGRSNVGAINILKTETKNYHFQQNNEYRDDIYEVEFKHLSGRVERIPIVHLFDVPHLIKCTRNNLLTKNLTFVTDGVQRVATWEHLIELYQTDSIIPDTKMLPRLTDNHVIPQQIPKMKVRYATQVFSQRISAVINFLACKNFINPKATNTATALLFFDKLFDSLNGSFYKILDGKIYRTSVNQNSVHHQLWQDSLKVLSTMKYIGHNGKPVVVPTLNNWSTTIKGKQIKNYIRFKIIINKVLNRFSNIIENAPDKRNTIFTSQTSEPRFFGKLLWWYKKCRMLESYVQYIHFFI